MVDISREATARSKDNLRVLTVGGLSVAHERPLIPSHDLSEIDIRFETDRKTLWASLKPKADPHFSPRLLGEITQLRRIVGEHLRTVEPSRRARFWVLGSRIPGVFNLGGDLHYFAELIRSHGRERLRQYAHDCIEAIHLNLERDPPVVSIALVQGDALGGGFEAALSFDVIIAERQARFGLPEILFNLFPGMGAYSLLSRRIGPRLAEKMILSGRIYSADELHAMGVVDLVVDDGTGQMAVEDYIASHERSFRAQQAIYSMRKFLADITWAELQHIADMWVETAMQLEENDLRRMLHLAMAQKRRRARQVWPAE